MATQLELGPLASRAAEKEVLRGRRTANGNGNGGKCGWNHSAIARGILLIEFCGALTLFAVAVLSSFYIPFIAVYIFFFFCSACQRGAFLGAGRLKAVLFAAAETINLPMRCSSCGSSTNSRLKWKHDTAHTKRKRSPFFLGSLPSDSTRDQ